MRPGKLLRAHGQVLGDEIEDLRAVVGRAARPAGGTAGCLHRVADVLAVPASRFPCQLSPSPAHEQGVAAVGPQLAPADVHAAWCGPLEGMPPAPAIVDGGVPAARVRSIPAFGPSDELVPAPSAPPRCTSSGEEGLHYADFVCVSDAVVTRTHARRLPGGPQVFVEPLAPPLAPVPALPVAAEAGRRVEDVGAVDPDRTGLHPRGNVQRQVDVLRPDACREPVPGVVRQPDRLAGRAEGHHHQPPARRSRRARSRPPAPRACTASADRRTLPPACSTMAARCVLPPGAPRPPAAGSCRVAPAR